MKIHFDEIMAIGLEYGGYDLDRQAKINKKETKVSYFVSFYGFSPATYSRIFEDFSNSQAVRGKLKKAPELSEFLMMGNWFKEGLTFNSLGGKFKMNPNTSNKWCWQYAIAVTELYEVKIPFGPFPVGTILILTVDGVHFRIKEPRKDPTSKWYSHKFNSPGLAYKIAVSTRQNQICWTNGPFKASVHDITIYRDGLRDMIPTGCMGIGDSGYAGEPDTLTVIRAGDSRETKKFKEAARARQETVNGRLKEFDIIDKRWPFDWKKHEIVFKALIVMLQYDLETTRPLFDIY